MEKNSNISTMSRFFGMLKNDRKDIYYIYLYAIVGGLINLSLPLGIQAILNFVQGGAVSSAWWLLIFVVTLGTFMAGVLVVMQMSVSETLQRRIFTRVSFDFAERLPRLLTEVIRREHIPELMNRFFDVLTLQKGLPKILMDLSTAVIQILFGLLVLSFYHPFFIFFGILLIIFLFLIFRFTGAAGLQTSLKESKYKYEVAYWLEEVGRTLHTFKLAGSSELPLQKTDYLVSNYLDAKEKHFKILIIQYSSIVVFKTLVTLALLGFGSYLVINNQINLGQFVAAELIVLTILSSSEKLIITTEVVYDVLTALEKIGAIADLPIEVRKGIDYEQINRNKAMDLKIQNLTFQFKDAEKPTLRDINLHIKSGEKVVVSGYNGSGKTTLVQIVSCFLSRFEGIMLYNDVPRQDLNPISLRKAIGDYSAQEDIFRGTLIENITLGYPSVSFDKVVDVVHRVGLADLVNSLPNGYHTVLQPEGKGLPRSAVVKIILARSIVTNPQLLAIEELFANLERKDRERIADILTAKNAPWTLVAVSDDPILACKADRILIMQKGEVVAQGTYEEIKNTPHFAKVFKVS